MDKKERKFITFPRNPQLYSDLKDSKKLFQSLSPNERFDCYRSFARASQVGDLIDSNSAKNRSRYNRVIKDLNFDEKKGLMCKSFEKIFLHQFSGQGQRVVLWNIVDESDGFMDEQGVKDLEERLEWLENDFLLDNYDDCLNGVICIEVNIKGSAVRASLPLFH